MINQNNWLWNSVMYSFNPSTPLILKEKHQHYHFVKRKDKYFTADDYLQSLYCFLMMKKTGNKLPSRYDKSELILIKILESPHLRKKLSDLYEREDLNYQTIIDQILRGCKLSESFCDKTSSELNTLSNKTNDVCNKDSQIINKDSETYNIKNFNALNFIVENSISNENNSENVQDILISNNEANGNDLNKNKALSETTILSKNENLLSGRTMIYAIQIYCEINNLDCSYNDIQYITKDIVHFIKHNFKIEYDKEKLRQIRSDMYCNPENVEKDGNCKPQYLRFYRQIINNREIFGDSVSDFCIDYCKRNFKNFKKIIIK